MPDQDFEIDPNLYVRSPIVDVPAGIALGIALITAYKVHAEALPESVGRAAKRLRKDTVTLQSGWDGQRDAGLVGAADKRPADQLADRTWAALSKRIEGLMLLPENVDEARRAAQIYARLFPTGLAFTQLPYTKQWAECEQRIRAIDKHELEVELRTLAGDVVVDALKAAHKNYGRALGITSAKESSPKAPNTLEQLRKLQKAVSNYAMQLVAAAKDDPEVGESVVACLGPIDDLRAAEGARTSSEASTPATPAATEVTPATPIPTLMDDG